MNIRKARPEDWEELKVMLRELVAEEPPVALELEPLIDKQGNWIANFPKGNLGFFTVAEFEGKIVGFCYLAVQKFYSPVAYIGIALNKEFRRKNLGSEMFYHVAGWASAEKLQYIVADIWVWNTNSIKFFKNLGFEEKSIFKDKFKGEEKDKARLVKKV
jgi:RimJ/RimL family protein N-acetyltransferase